jgi:hypothetical protein
MRALDDLVVHIGEVHHLLHFPPAKREHAPQKIPEQKRAEVSEVRRSVHRRTARVYPHGLTVGGRERLDRAGQSVIQAEIRCVATLCAGVRGAHSRKLGLTLQRVNTRKPDHGH